MAEKVAEGWQIHGLVTTDNNKINIEEFSSKFLQWCKDNNWVFDGNIRFGLKDK